MEGRSRGINLNQRGIYLEGLMKKGKRVKITSAPAETEPGTSPIKASGVIACVNFLGSSLSKLAKAVSHLTFRYNGWQYSFATGRLLLEFRSATAKEDLL
jgi:hypothetical protein